MQNEIRDYDVCFNFTLKELGHEGTEYLLGYYGGEVINMPLCGDPELDAVLQTIGQPLIVECYLNPADLTTSSELPWGKVWLSSYHVSINPKACQHDVDAHHSKSVRPEQIISTKPPKLPHP